MSKKRFTITSALLYANGPIHIGHIAGAYLPADIFVRYHRLKGDEVLFICGSRCECRNLTWLIISPLTYNNIY